jgi:hypothetical protein
VTGRQTERTTMPGRYRYGGFAAWLLALLLCVTAQPVAAERNLDWYDVEVVVFRQFDGGGIRSDERWPVVTAPASFERRAFLSEHAGEADEPVFRLLPENSLGLRNTVQRLRGSDRYEILIHKGWRQPGLPDSEAPAIHFPQQPEHQSGPAERPTGAYRVERLDGGVLQLELEETAVWVPPGLSGYLRLIRERYLHMEVDLRYREAPARATGDTRRLAGAEFDEVRDPVIVMRDRRRMRSGELHYLDNPRLGMLVLVRPVED